MTRQRRLSAAEADLLAMKLRRENMVASHKAMMDEYKTRNMIKAAEKIKNNQNEYGNLLSAHSRLPLGLQGPALRRMRDIGQILSGFRDQYPLNFPSGPMPRHVIRKRPRRRNDMDTTSSEG